MIGAESFTGVWQNALAELPPAEVEAWLELVEETATTPEGLGASDHFLYIGRKRVEPSSEKMASQECSHV